jgi:hypothetical protein
MSFYSDQAAQFQKLAANIETRKKGAGSAMDDGTRTRLSHQQDVLQDQADAMIADDVQATLAGLALDQTRIAACTASLNRAMQTVKTFNSMVAIGEAGLTLVTACVSGNPESIFTALAGAEKAVSDALKSNVTAMPQPAGGAKAGTFAETIESLAASGDPGDTGN